MGCKCSAPSCRQRYANFRGTKRATFKCPDNSVQQWKRVIPRKWGQEKKHVHVWRWPPFGWHYTDKNQVSEKRHFCRGAMSSCFGIKSFSDQISGIVRLRAGNTIQPAVVFTKEESNLFFIFLLNESQDNCFFTFIFTFVVVIKWNWMWCALRWVHSVA